METQDLRKVGLKVTHPRIRILELLETSGAKHMSAEDIYKHLIGVGEDIGLATVYRVLTQFEAAGLVLKHNFEGGTAVYETITWHAVPNFEKSNIINLNFLIKQFQFVAVFVRPRARTTAN